jgi:cobalamin synthase
MYICGIIKKAMKRLDFSEYGWGVFFVCIFCLLAYSLATGYKTYSIREIIEAAILLVLLVWNALAVFRAKKPAALQESKNKLKQYGKIIVTDPRILLYFFISASIICNAVIEYQTYNPEKIVKHAVFFVLFVWAGIIVLKRKLR